MKTCICALFRSSLFWIIITALICVGFNVLINIIISYTYLFLINKFVPSSYLFVKYFLILILFIYNWLILRKIVISWLFEWQFPIQKFSIYKERQNYLTYFKARLNNFIKAIEVITNVKYKLAKKEIESIEYFLYLFDEELNIYENLYNWIINDNNRTSLVKYKMSKCQIKYYNLLKSVNRVLNENDLKTNLLNLKDTQNYIKMNNFNENQNFENKKVFAHLNMLLNEIKKTIAKYDWENYTYMSPAYLYNLFFNDTFGSLSLYSLQFKKKFEDYQIEQNFTPKGKVHYSLIRNYNYQNNNENDLISENSKNNDGPLMIFCLPNGGCYELIPKLKIEFYLNNGFSFLCWNYKGYGYSKGRSNFSNCKSDVLELYDTIVKNPKYNFSKICVMGHSIGGVAACYLATKRNVNLLISDRNFCDMKRLVNNFRCGKVLSFLIKYLFIGTTDNIKNFINYGNIEEKRKGIMNINSFNEEGKIKINRIILYSPIDNLILNDATVKSGVARYFIKNYIFYKNDNNQIIKNKENLLDIIFNKNDKTRFLNNFLNILHFYYDKNKGNKSYGNNNYISLNVKNDQNKNSIIDGTINFAQEKHEIDETLFLFFDKFFGICCDNFNFLIAHKVSLRREGIFIDNFFNNLLIWGVQGGDLENEDTFEFYSYKGKKILQEAYDILNNFCSKNNHMNISPISMLIKNVSEDLKIILNVINKLDIIKKENENKKHEMNNDISLYISENSIKEKLIQDNDEINTNSILMNNSKEKILTEENDFYNKLNSIKGSIKLFKSFAGHNGLIRPDEREHFYTFLLDTGIIN